MSTRSKVWYKCLFDTCGTAASGSATGPFCPSDRETVARILKNSYGLGGYGPRSHILRRICGKWCFPPCSELWPQWGTALTLPFLKRNVSLSFCPLWALASWLNSKDKYNLMQHPRRFISFLLHSTTIHTHSSSDILQFWDLTDCLSLLAWVGRGCKGHLGLWWSDAPRSSLSELKLPLLNLEVFFSMRILGGSAQPFLGFIWVDTLCRQGQRTRLGRILPLWSPPKPLEKECRESWSSLSIREVFTSSNKRSYYSKISICACHASGSTSCTVNFSSPTPATVSALPTICVASHSNRREKNILKIGKCDCQTPNLDRWNSEGKSNLRDHI